MTTEFSIPSRDDIEINMTLLAPLRNRQTLVVCILSNSEPGVVLYDTTVKGVRDIWFEKMIERKTEVSLTPFCSGSLRHGGQRHLVF